MKKIVLLVLFVFCCCVVISCVPKTFIVKSVKLDLDQQSPPTKAKVVFIQPQLKTGSLPLSIYDGDKLIGILGSYNFFIYESEPGDHIFACSWPLDFLQAKLQAGKTYYVQAVQGNFYPISKMIAIKRDSDIMKNLDNICAKLHQAEIIEAGYKLFNTIKIEDEAFIKQLGTSTKIPLTKIREKWLEKTIETHKPKLLPEDGISKSSNF